jgi:aminopeptidase N
MSLRLILASSVALFSFFSFGQNENTDHCSKRSKHGSSLKSASLTVEQISLTELYDVHFYQLDLAMNNVQTNVAGTGEIHAQSNMALDSALFELHANYVISEIRVNSNPVTYNRVGSAIKVPVNTLGQDFFVISIDYSGVPPTGASTPFGGGGMTHASSPSWGNRVTWSLSEPFSAYEWWPCKQSLTDKADSCAVKITVPDTCKAGSNGLLENVVNLGNGFSRYEWKHRHPIDYYLISVAVAKYVDYTVYANPAGAPGPIMIQNFIYDNPQTLINFQDEIDETVDFMELFYELYGPYPFEDEKYGHCMAPLSGGMEHQTMTTQGFFEKGLTAHELGHQWWGNNVTCASWSDIWVNEGFASYSEYLMLQNLYPGQQNAHMTDVHDNVMSQANGSTWVLDSLNETRIFSGRLTYDKGAAIIHTLRYIIDNDALFFQTLRNFQNDFADSTARGVDVQNAFEVASGLDLNSFFEQWYFGEGYPTYSLRWNEIGNDILLQVSHTASFGGVTPTFTNPIDVRIFRSGQTDTIVTLAVNSNLDQFYFPGIGDATSMTIDPQNWVINKVGTVQFDQNLLGIEGNLLADDLVIYPNPSNGVFTVSTSQKGEIPFTVYHMNGKILTSGNTSDGQTLDLQNAQPGSYLIEIGSRRKLVNIIH